MKKTLLPLATILFFALLFCSCEKKQIQAYVPEVQSGSQLLNNNTLPDVLFSLLEINESTGGTSGWLVNKQGEVFSINSTGNPIDFELSEIHKSKMNFFLSNSTKTNTRLDIETLASYFTKTRALVGRDMNVVSEDVEAQKSTYFIGFDLYLDDQACENCPGTAVSPNEFSQVLLKAEGVINGQIEHNFTRDIVTWMREVNSGL
jgi:hypothetical protein